MNSFWTKVIIFGFLAYLGFGYLGGVMKDETANTKMGDLQAQYQRRADLIPDLVATVKGVAAQETKLFSEITKARAAATQPQFNINAAELASNPELMKQFTEAQDNLSGALSRLLAIRENYPEMKSNQAFKDLMTQLEGTENRISVARQRYNGAVGSLNTFRRIFLTANMATDGNHQYFQSKAGAEDSPDVSF